MQIEVTKVLRLLYIMSHFTLVSKFKLRQELKSLKRFESLDVLNTILLLGISHVWKFFAVSDLIVNLSLFLRFFPCFLYFVLEHIVSLLKIIVSYFLKKQSLNFKRVTPTCLYALLSIDDYSVDAVLWKFTSNKLLQNRQFCGKINRHLIMFWCI